MSIRRFRNDNDTAVVAPTLGIALGPGEIAEIDVDDEILAVGSLTEITHGEPEPGDQSQAVAVVATAHDAVDQAKQALHDAEQAVQEAVKTVEGGEAEAEAAKTGE